jgi:hypothetical protein
MLSLGYGTVQSTEGAFIFFWDGSVVGRVTMLQAGRSRILFPMKLQSL